MDLRDAIRTTGAVREFLAEPVPDTTVHRILESARFAPSGGNRQGWHLILVRDQPTRQRLRDLYLAGWSEYLAQVGAGLVPWAPITDQEAEQQAIAAARPPGRTGLPSRFDEVPVMLVLLADLRRLAAVDRDLPHYTLVGGASIYPFAWNILLAAREEGLGGVITTMAIREEPAIKQLLNVPDELAVAGIIVLGQPVKQPRRLTRASVDSFTTVDAFDGEPFREPTDAEPRRATER